ncbi:MAG: hypothetical protein KGO50_17935, partial [Myxococcales bacterium]|nr:hypothetical protein [Myxococcales bacterium]
MARPLGANRRVGVRVLGVVNKSNACVSIFVRRWLRRYALCWLAGQRIAEYEQALAQMLNDIHSLDAH